MNKVTLYNPAQLVFGSGSIEQLAQDFPFSSNSNLYIITLPYILESLNPILKELKSKGVKIKTHTSIKAEPSFSDCYEIISDAKTFGADSIAGIGGGSIMDVAKVVAALLDSEQTIEQIVGKNQVDGRKTLLICAPTTSGTGSEVSPNSILMDDKGVKKGIVSPYLVPDIVYIDPDLTLSVPADVTAFTGIDAMTHCIEAFANLNAHPAVDHLALEGIRLISNNLREAVKNPSDSESRANLALGSMYGGMCLGPVNTAAVHALAYPVGGNYKIPHGLSNAVLLPYVIEYNLDFAIEKYAQIAIAMGATKGSSDKETALRGVDCIKQLLKDCNVPMKISELNIPYEDIDGIAAEAVQIERLLANNVRKLDITDIKTIYSNAF